jgi:hypothetical protein
MQNEGMAEDQTASHIQTILGTNGSDDIFFFLHGRDQPAGVIDGSGTAVIDQSTISLLKSRTVCGTCYSLDDLAILAVAHGATIIGYTGEMLIPLDPPYVQEMESAALAPHRSLMAGQNAQIAASSGSQEYSDVATRWFKNGTFTGVVHSALAEANAQAIGNRP